MTAPQPPRPPFPPRPSVPGSGQIIKIIQLQSISNPSIHFQIGPSVKEQKRSCDVVFYGDLATNLTKKLAKVFKHSEHCARLANQGWSSEQLWMARGVIVQFYANLWLKRWGIPLLDGCPLLFFSKRNLTCWYLVVFLVLVEIYWWLLPFH